MINSDFVRRHNISAEDIDHSLFVNNRDDFEQYKSDRLITVIVNGKSYDISHTVVEAIIETEYMYYYFLNNLKRNSSLGMRISLVSNKGVEEQFNIPKAPIVFAINKYLKDNPDLSNTLKQRIGLINSLIDKNSLYCKYSNFEYTCEVNGKKYNYKGVILLDLLFMSSNEFSNYISNNNVDKETIRTIIVNFLDDEQIFTKYVLEQEAYNRYKELVEDIQNKEKEDKIDNVPIVDEELVEVLKDGMNESYDQMEQAIYLYIKLSDLMEIDKTSKYSNLYDITLMNNKVTTETFRKLYMAILNEFNIGYYIYYDEIKIKQSEYTISISFGNISVEDISNIRSDCMLNISKDKLDEKIYNVYKDYFDRLTIHRELLNNIEQYKQEYYYLVGITKRDKLFTILKLITSRRLKGNDSVEYIKDVFNKINGDDENNQLYVLYKKVDEHTRPIIVVSLFENGIYKYIMIDTNSKEVLKNVSKMELLDIVTQDGVTYSSPICGLEDEEDARTIKVESSRTTGERQKQI